MNEQIKVSIVMAIYNVAKYINKSIDSLLDQTMQDFEIICVDDGSTDASLNILNEYAKKDARIKILINPKRADGAGAARNYGLNNAKGKYVIVLDADDFFESELLEKVYNRIEQTSSDIVMFDAYLYNNAYGKDDIFKKFLVGRFFPSKSTFSPQENSEQLFQMTMGAAWNMMISLNYININGIRFQEDIFHADDIGFSYLALACASRISILNEKLVHYRKFVTNSQSANLRKSPCSGYRSMQWLKHKLEEKRLFEKYCLSFSNRALEYLLIYLHAACETDSFHDLFCLLKEKAFFEFGITDLNGNNSYYPHYLKERDLVLNCSPEEYLVKQFLDENNKVTYKMFLKKGTIIQRIGDRKLILYGAGEQGIEWFSTLLRYGIRVEKWVDLKWKELGCFVSAPEEIEVEEDQICLVAIESYLTFNIVKDFLIDKGFDTEQIIWIQEN